MHLSWNEADIVFFDMDDTLIANDCDVSWKEFLVDIGLAPEDERAHAQGYWDDYCAGRLDQQTFLGFQLRQFVGKTIEDMRALSRRHFEARVRARIYPQARKTIAAILERGAPAVLLSATNRIIAEPIAKAFRMTDVICTELERRDGVFTGGIIPPYCFREGKVARAQACCASRGTTLRRATYFGDSPADIPMLESVGAAVVVNPRGQLLAKAQEKGWTIERWTIEET